VRDTSVSAAPPARHVHPWIYLLLILPFGATSGFVTVAVAWQLDQAHVPVDRIALVVSLVTFPHAWKFLWAPIADATLTRKRWYLLGSMLSALGIFATGALPATTVGLLWLSVSVLTMNFAVTFLGMAVEALMAYATPEIEKGRVGGWFMAGNLGGSGLGGGAGLWLIQRLPAPWMAGAVVAALCLLCCLALTQVDEPAEHVRQPRILAGLRHAVVDLWAATRSHLGWIALVLCFMPLGTGGASGLWSAVAKDWHASANTVALVTGVLSGIISAMGCLGGGWLCDRMDRKAAYAVFGALQALCAVAMALLPHGELQFILLTSLYAFINGFCYAAFTAYTLEAIGRGAAATKYNAFASMSNVPIWYVTVVDGWAYVKWGASGMLYTEAALAAIGLAVFGVVVLFWRRPVNSGGRIR
jgi:MFS transporter, PAT family, beta-lactamase induction signal transducer AmpG